LGPLRDYLDESGIEKIIVVKKPNLDREINLKVEVYSDEADFVIILATGDSKDRNNNTIPSGNVLHEIGLAQSKSKFKGKIIYLLEEIAEFPSNIKPKSYILFNRYHIEYKFGDIVKEIKAMCFL
jgi:predicted nucleotide-binding protein